MPYSTLSKYGGSTFTTTAQFRDSCGRTEYKVVKNESASYNPWAPVAVPEEGKIPHYPRQDPWNAERRRVSAPVELASQSKFFA
jgi:hypothetical protein